jgi:DnaJ-class molecular chaperone
VKGYYLNDKIIRYAKVVDREIKLFMSKRDYYEILGVGKNASTDEIKKAYRKVAMQHHPDRNPAINQLKKNLRKLPKLMKILSDTDKKAQYDRYGHAGVSSTVAVAIAWHYEHGRYLQPVW